LGPGKIYASLTVLEEENVNRTLEGEVRDCRDSRGKKWVKKCVKKRIQWSWEDVSDVAYSHAPAPSTEEKGKEKGKEKKSEGQGRI